jgi:hypothetical protein
LERAQGTSGHCDALVGFLAKGRELVASLTLVVIMELLFVVATHSERLVERPDTFLQLLIRAVEFPAMIALGAGSVRDLRLGKLPSQV